MTSVFTDEEMEAQKRRCLALLSSPIRPSWVLIPYLESHSPFLMELPASGCPTENTRSVPAVLIFVAVRTITR